MNFEAFPSPSAEKTIDSSWAVNDLRTALREDGERLELLQSKLRSLVLIGGNAGSVLHVLDRLQHEAASKDDSDYDYENVMQDLNEINNLIVRIPDLLKL